MKLNLNKFTLVVSMNFLEICLGECDAVLFPKPWARLIKTRLMLIQD